MDVLLELKRNWFGPDGVRYRAEVRGSRHRHRVPDAVAAQAPTDAKVYTADGKFLGLRKDWSQEAEAAAKVVGDLRTAVDAARAKATAATAAVTTAEATHKAETDAGKKKEAAEAVTATKAGADTAKKELDEAIAALEEAEKKKD